MLLLLLLAQDVVAVTAPAVDKERRYVLLETKLAGAGPFRARDKDSGVLLPAQGDGSVVRWLVPSIPAGAKRSYAVEKGEAPGASLTLADSDGGVAIKAGAREITRWRPAAGVANKKPCFYPLTAHGVNVLRGFPLEDVAGEAKDHPHHTGVYHAFGEVNGREYWSKTAIENRKASKEAGQVYARIRAENAWGEDLVETQDVFVLNAGDDAVMDWTITLTAAAGDVVLGKDPKMSKEGSFAVRVRTELTRKGDAPEMMSDALGNKGEKAIRAAAAPWVDYTGEIGGKKLGVAVMDHPTSFRAPTNWHVRAYGLFAANPWLVRGENKLGKGESLTLRYRIYVHAGGPEDAKVAEVYAGFANAKAE